MNAERMFTVMFDYPDGQRKAWDYETATQAERSARAFNRRFRKARRRVRGDCRGAVVVETMAVAPDPYPWVDWPAINEQEDYERSLL